MSRRKQAKPTRLSEELEEADFRRADGQEQEEFDDREEEEEEEERDDEEEEEEVEGDVDDEEDEDLGEEEEDGEEGRRGYDGPEYIAARHKRLLQFHSSGDPDELHICPYCRAELSSREQLEEHRVTCGREPPVLPVSDNPRPQFQDNDHPDELRRHQDVANNNQAHILKNRSTSETTSNSRESSVDRNNGYDSDSNNPLEGGALAHIRNLLAQSQSSSTPSTPTVGPIAQQIAQSNLTLEAIQNTRMAIAQFATSAMNSPTANNPHAMQEFAVLQGTLFSLQQQQMMQLQLIQQLQAQLSIKKDDSPPTPNQLEDSSKGPREVQESHETPSPPTPASKPAAPPTSEASQGVSSSFINTLMERFKVPSMNNDGNNERPRPSSPLCSPSTSGPSVDPRDRPLSPPMTASSIASSVIQHTEPPPPDEPNTLEMLQRTANNVLNNASQGLLTSRLIDDHKPQDGKDPYYKHRCRYCGKVFGSDSALQIHIRSHTGERPFKCNICGNRFTTKGNLKVHFQRHTSRFPHVKMNPHPVPEHLDKLYPPLLAQLGELKDYPPPPTGPPNPFTSLGGGPSIPPYRLPGPPPSSDLHRPFNLLNIVRQSREEPENLSIADPRSSPEPSERDFVLGRLDSSRMDIDESSRHSKFDGQMETNEGTEPGSVEMAEDRDEPFDDKSLSQEKRFDDDEDDDKLLDENKKLKEEKGFEDEKIDDDERRESSEEKSEEKQFKNEKTYNEEKSMEGENEEDRFEAGLQFKTETMREESEERFMDSQEMRDLMDRKSSEGETSSDQTPIDIRVRTEKELKEAGEGNNTNTKDDHDMDSNDSRSVPSEQPTDLRMRPDFRPLGMPTIPIPGPRLPLNFPFLPGIPTSFPGPMGPPPNIPPGIDPAKDPSIYTNLLPKPGSNDNSWEALIEIQKTSETMKLEQLVNNIENKLTDPNQCIICHRVLSCKSALQMHYRTHTGERPFKCKICGRAFTTKGNLKTHMGVHRAKPPMRMLHQCPVCHKKYTNALVLQQHIRQHTGEPTDLSPEQIAAAEVRDFPHLPTPTSLPQMLPSGFPLPPPPIQGFPPLPLHLRYQLSPEAFRHRELIENEDRNADEDKYLRPFSTSSRSSSTGSAEQRTAEDLTVRSREDGFNGMTSPRVSVSPTPSDYSDLGDRSHEAHGDNQVSPSGHQVSGSVSPAISTGSQEGLGSLPLDLAPRPNAPFFSPFGLFPPPLTTAALTPGTHSMPGLNPVYLPSIPGRGNTTCQLCFKTFACQSALEIHIRSHTKERPFKCSICDRGFSTKGNMKQHMLTHKIRDGCRDTPMDPGFKHNGMGNPDTSSASPLPPTLTSSASHTTPLPSSLPSPLPSSLASPLAPSHASPIHPLLPSPLPRSLASPMPPSLTSPHTRPMTSPLPSSLTSPLPSSMASPLPPSLVSSLPSSLVSPLPSSLPSSLPVSLSSTISSSIHCSLPPSFPPAALAAVLLQQAREEDKLLDSRLKREREGENVLPVPKRASGLGGEGELLEGAEGSSPGGGDQQLTPDPASCPSPAPEVTALPRT
ncbi:homeotic protein spalt-major-like isoform X3 [Macrobrachium rosenbergii]|uniref:homeotic protein spalt-major-like isoform X3 n=1 Tax=Macrobrachium rosenbergii TaxID=79674 RepID=UPI0034D6BC9F